MDHSDTTARRVRGGLAALAATLLLGAPLARAADFPKSGEATFDVYLTGKLLMNAETTVGNGELWQELGVTHNVKGEQPFDRLDDVCLGQDTALDGKPTRGFGTCVKTDKDGDKILVTFGEVKDHWAIVGGTGKYKGIVGTGTSTPYDMIRDQPREWSAVAHETIKWRIE